MLVIRAFIVTLFVVASEVLSAQNVDEHSIPQQSLVEYGADYAVDAVKDRMKSMALQPIEGIWYYNEEKTTLAIERSEETFDGNNMSYRIVYMDSDDYDMLPGTIVGYIEKSADNNKYALWLYSERDLGNMFKPVRCVATLSDHHSMLSFVKPAVKLKFRMNVARFLPTLFKGLSVIAERGSETMPLGFRKIYPAMDENGTSRGVIRYL